MWLVEFGYTNNTAKTIVGAKFNAGWMDATADYHHILDVWGSDSKVKPGAHKKERWNPPPESSHNKGWLVAPKKILYSDGSSWQISPEDKTCFDSFLYKGQPPITEAPALLLMKEGLSRITLSGYTRICARHPTTHRKHPQV